LINKFIRVFLNMTIKFKFFTVIGYLLTTYEAETECRQFRWDIFPWDIFRIHTDIFGMTHVQVRNIAGKRYFFWLRSVVVKCLFGST
jgi:hypothetical protein